MYLAWYAVPWHHRQQTEHTQLQKAHFGVFGRATSVQAELRTAHAPLGLRRRKRHTSFIIVVFSVMGLT